MSELPSNIQKNTTFIPDRNEETALPPNVTCNSFYRHPEKHSFEIEKGIRSTPKPNPHIHKNTTFNPDITNGETAFLSNVTCNSFYLQDRNNCDGSSCLLHLSGNFESFQVSPLNNLRTSTPKSSILYHSNNLQRTPEVAPFVNRSRNLQSSTPKASTLLSPFESNLTEVKFEDKNVNGGNRNKEAGNCKVFKSDTSNDIFEFQSCNNSSLPFKSSNYEDCVSNSLNNLKFKCNSLKSASLNSIDFNLNELQAPSTNSEILMTVDKALKIPNESTTISGNEYIKTENSIKSEGKDVDEVSKICNSESPLESFNLNNDLISFQEDLKCNANDSYIDSINLINFSSDSDGKLFSNASDTMTSTDELASTNSLIHHNSHNGTICELMSDILNNFSPKTSNVCLPFCSSKLKDVFPITGESSEVFWSTNNAEKLAEDAETTFIKRKIPNISEFHSETCLLDPVKIIKVTNKSKLNYENNSDNDFNNLTFFSNDENNFTECNKALDVESPETIKAENIAMMIMQKRYGNSFHGSMYKKLPVLTSGTFSSILDMCSHFSKTKRNHTEPIFVLSNPKATTINEYYKTPRIDSCCKAKLPLDVLKPLTINDENNSILFYRRFKTLIERYISNTNLLNVPICKVQESLLNFELYKELTLLKKQNSNSSMLCSFLQTTKTSEQKRIDDKSNGTNSCYSIRPTMKRVNSETKNLNALSNNSEICLKSDSSLSFVKSENYFLKPNRVSQEKRDSNINLKPHNIHQIPNKTNEWENVECNKEKFFGSKNILKLKDLQSTPYTATFVPMHSEFLRSQTNMVEAPILHEDISETYENTFLSSVPIHSSMKFNPNYRNDSSETDVSMTSNSDTENIKDNCMKTQDCKKFLPLQELFDIDQTVAKAVIQSFTDLGLNRGLKQSQIVKHINLRMMLKTHSKVNRDIQHFLKVATEVGIMKKRRFKYFLTEVTSSFSKNRKDDNKCKTSEKKSKLKAKSPPLTKIKTEKEVQTPTRIKPIRTVFKMKTPLSTRIESKQDALEIKTPIRIKTKRVTFKVGTPASVRMKQSRKSLRSSSKAKRLFLETKTKSFICNKTETELRSPMIFKKLRSRVVLVKKDA